MPQLLLCNTSTTTNTLDHKLGIAPDTVTGVGCTNLGTLNAYRPYLATDKTPTAEDFAVLTQFSSAPVSKELTHLSLCYGADTTLALSEISDTLQKSGIGVMGAGTSIYGNRLASFTDAVKNYQGALLNYREVMKGGGASKVLAKQNVARTFGKMQIGFQHELHSVTGGIKASQKGTPFTNATRAMNIAKSSRTVVKLELNNQVQASQLARFGKSAKLLGNGLVVIDFASRVGNIQNSFDAGENWERELFIESSSFATSTVAGAIAIKAGLSLLMVATPVGWVGLIIGATVLSIGINNTVKNNAGDIYDEIMKGINTL